VSAVDYVTLIKRGGTLVRANERASRMYARARARAHYESFDIVAASYSYSI